MKDLGSDFTHVLDFPIFFRYLDLTTCVSYGVPCYLWMAAVEGAERGEGSKESCLRPLRSNDFETKDSLTKPGGLSTSMLRAGPLICGIEEQSSCTLIWRVHKPR